ncbi:MAG: hypothetical protein CMJ49_11855 [Planctomycetaceae bacterium]|nr:hypothetical protein [Planctomycetaceae bacterium]
MADGSDHLTGHRYLRVQDLRRLRRLVFSARRPVEGLYAGRHGSLQRGRSVEFSDYRPYMPGDEVGDIDWKVYGRSDRLYVKLFEHQSDLTIRILVDGSASMAYSGMGGPARRSLVLRSPRPGESDRKYDTACRIAGAIAFLTISQQDRAGFAIAQRGLAVRQEPGGSYAHLHRMLGAMEQTEPTGEADLPRAIDDLSETAQRRGLLVLISDLLDDRDATMRAISRFTHLRHEVIVFHVLHGDELNLPRVDEARFVDSETGGGVRLNVRDVRRDYTARMRDFLDGWSAVFRSRGMDYRMVNVADPPARALEDYLFRRAATG